MTRIFAFSAALSLSSLLGAGGAAAQTTPARTTPPARDTSAARLLPSEKPPVLKTQGEYVAPGMTGAPRQNVKTGYDGKPLPSVLDKRDERAEQHQSSYSAESADHVKSKPIRRRRSGKE